MPPSPQRLALTLGLLVSSGFADAAPAPTKTLQIDTPTTTGQTLGGSDSLTISAPGSITTSKVAVTLKDGTTGNGVVIDNSGSITSTGGRAIDSSGSLTGARNYSIYNRAGGVIQGANDAL
ncbi:autotransporter domain-containing protein, partial [Pseudomonas sp. K5002]|nr:autotransporter domain-containing protein [Pseudomonas sp. K5002]